MTISVVITAYNIQDYIEDCLKSIDNQKNVNLQIIVVNDFSTDNTAKVIEDYKNNRTSEHEFIICNNPANHGAGMSRRIGIYYSTGEFVILIDGDDYLENDYYLSDLLETAIKEDADIVTGGITILKESGIKIATTYGNKTTTGNESVFKFWGDNIVYLNNRLIRKELHNKVPYCTRRYVEDTPVIIPMLWYSNKVAYVENAGYVYRMRNTSLTHTSNKVKDLIYKGLCWCELVHFFMEKDKEILKNGHIINYIHSIYNVINSSTFSKEEIEPYKEDWIEFTRQLFNLTTVKEISVGK